MGAHDSDAARLEQILDGDSLMNAVFECMMEFFSLKRASLPEDIQTVLSAAIVTVRDSGDGDSRAVVGLGRSMFYADEAADRIRKRWPELTARQVQRACDYLDARIRIAATPIKRERRRGWIHDF